MRSSQAGFGFCRILPIIVIATRIEKDSLIHQIMYSITSVAREETKTASVFFYTFSLDAR